MKDITILIPVHKFDDTVAPLLKKAIDSVIDCQTEYKDKLVTWVVCPKSIENDISSSRVLYDVRDKFSIISHDGDTDYCSQINFAVDKVETDFFSILEFDDEYYYKWFKIVKDYYYGNESVSVFLPINIQCDPQEEHWQYGNELAVSNSFNSEDEFGVINFKSLESCSMFNLTGGVINTSDFIKVGKYKPSIKVAFNYEFLLRLTNKKLKALVIPKEGYKHVIGREGSLTDEYLKTIPEGEGSKWFALAYRECKYDEDRNKGIDTVTDELK